MLGVTLAVSAAILTPLAVVVWRSFHVEQGLLSSTLSLQNYARLGSPRTLSAMLNSAMLGVGVALVAGVWGTALAWIVTRTNVPRPGWLNGLNLVPFFISPLLGAVAWSYLGSPATGLLNRTLMDAFGLSGPPFDIYSPLGLIWVSGIFHVPFVYLFCVGALRQMDPALEQAALVSGASQAVALARVTLPLAAPAILSGVVLTFVVAIEDLGTPLVLGYSHNIQTISTQIYDGIQRFPPDYNFGAALGCLLMAIAGVGLVAQRRMMARRSFVTVTGRGYRPTRLDLGWGKYAALAVNVAYLLAAVALPIGTLLVVSFSRAWLGYIDPSQFSLQYYVYLATTSPIALRAARNSLLLAAVGATGTVLLACLVAYVIHRTKSSFRGWLDAVTTVPIGVPGLVMAIGLFVTLLRTPVYATLWILLIAYAVRYFPYGQRGVSASIVSLAAELEESSRMSGAGWFTTMRRVMLPLLRPGLVAAWLLLFITFMREVSMSMLLARSGTETLSTALFSLLGNDPTGASSAFTLVQVSMTLVVTAIFLRVSKSEDIRV